MTVAEVDSKPHVLVVGQYSTGKTTFIEQLIGTAYTGSNIGPEMTTDHFTAVLHSPDMTGQKIPGNATKVRCKWALWMAFKCAQICPAELIWPGCSAICQNLHSEYQVDSTLPYGGLRKFGDGFLANFCAAHTPLPSWSLPQDQAIFDYMRSNSTSQNLSALADEVGMTMTQLECRKEALHEFSGRSSSGVTLTEDNRPPTNDLLRRVTFIDSPGVLSGEKQRLSRSYDFAAVTRWFAERSDLILLLFDAHKLDISDEFKDVITGLAGLENKVRCVLNKADQIRSAEVSASKHLLVFLVYQSFNSTWLSR